MKLCDFLGEILWISWWFFWISLWNYLGFLGGIVLDFSLFNTLSTVWLLGPVKKSMLITQLWNLFRGFPIGQNMGNLNIAKASRRHSQTFLTLNRHLLTPSFLPESLLTSLDNSNASQNVWQVLGRSQQWSCGDRGMVLGCLGCFKVSRGVWGC